jgi:TolB-like protein
MPNNVDDPMPDNSESVTLAFTIIIGGILGVTLWHPKPPIVAVARFDNETGLAAMTAFSDALTDMVVVRLTAGAGAKFGIVGNAQPLRQPRPYRDLLAIASSLKAKYVILGQVQGSAAHRRVLAHLIRLPGQTHVSVARFDRDAGDDLQTETELSRLIAANFLQHLH